jgi:SnoaL-like domain
MLEPSHARPAAQEDAMPDETVATVVQKYAQAWNEPSETVRRELLEASWADRGQYTDPTAHVDGRDDLVLHIGGFHRRWPGARIEISSGVDVHHQVIRFKWQMIGPDGAITLEGMDFGELAADGRLQRIVGFFGPFPASS